MNQPFLNYRYEKLAIYLTDLIDNGTLLPGMRAPSLRQISAQQRVSMSTALQAYRQLEDRGLLEGRPKSGFYVARRESAALALPQTSRPPARAAKITVSQTAIALLQHAANPMLVPLGCAIPSARLLSAGQLDRFLARAARTRGSQYNIYTEPKGDLRLRQEIGRRAMLWGQAQLPQDMAITCGCTEALNLALRATTRPGDTVAIESPTYFGLLQIIETLGLKALELPTAPDTGVDLAALDKALRKNRIAVCLFSSSINNPLGCTMAEDQKCSLLDLLAAHQVPLIEDDIYGDIYFSDTRPRPFSALRPEADVIYCSSFSKTIAPGYRLGWIHARRRMEKIMVQKFAQTLSGPALTQAAFADFLVSGGYDNHLRRIRRVFIQNVDRMQRAIEGAFPPGTRVSRPSGGFVLWLQLPGGLKSRPLFDQALAKGICFAPGDAFSASNRYSHCMRLSCGDEWDERMQSAILELGAMATAMLDAPPQ